MLQTHIKDSIADVQALIAITKEDIEDIKQAKHEAIFARMKPKEDLIDAFFHKKELAKEIIQGLVEQRPGVEVRELVGPEAVALFDTLNTHLFELKEANLHFARLSAAVGEFYRSMLDKIIPSESGYRGRHISKDVNFISVDA